MPRIETTRILRFITLAFSMDDWNEINDQALGFTENHARVRCLRKHDRRMS